MPSNFNNSKTTGGSIWPIDAIDTGGNFSRIESLVTPEILRKDWLFAVPLHDTRTNTRITDEDLKRTINRSISDLELDLKINIFPVRRQHKVPFDLALYRYYGFIEIPYKPISTLMSMYVEDANFNNIFQFPATIIETRNLWMGQITFGPITVETSNGYLFSPVAGGGLGSLLLMQQLAALSMPAFYVVDFISGWPENRLPSVINELIAITAAIEVLSRVQVLFRTNSQSISHDGLSSSSSGMGPQIFTPRITELKEKRDRMIDQLKHIYYNSIIMSNV